MADKSRNAANHGKVTQSAHVMASCKTVVFKPYHRSGGCKRYSGKGVGVLAAADIFQEPHAYGIFQQFDRHNLDMGDLGLRKPYAI